MGFGLSMQELAYILLVLVALSFILFFPAQTRELGTGLLERIGITLPGEDIELDDEVEQAFLDVVDLLNNCKVSQDENSCFCNKEEITGERTLFPVDYNLEVKDNGKETFLTLNFKSSKAKSKKVSVSGCLGWEKDDLLKPINSFSREDKITLFYGGDPISEISFVDENGNTQEKEFNDGLLFFKVIDKGDVRICVLSSDVSSDPVISSKPICSYKLPS